MDSMGTLDLAWAQGYDGERTEFISRDTVCFKCGNCVKFVSEDGHENVFSSPANSIGAIAVHYINKVFAIADVTLKPKIYVYQYPSQRQIAELEDGAALEYAYMTFSASDFLATVTGVPDHQLLLWRYTDGTKLCSYDLSPLPLTSLSFNPANWRQLCMSNEKDIFLWTIEQRDDIFLMKRDKLKLPTEGARTGSIFGGAERDIPTRASTRMTRVTVDLPSSSIAGVKGEDAERFDEYCDDEARTVAVSHCWTPAGDVLVGCDGGQLLRIDGEQLFIKVLYNPGPRLSSAASRGESAKSRLSEIDDRTYSSLPDNSSSQRIIAGSLSCLALHKSGLYAGGFDGNLRHMEVINDNVKVANSYLTGACITSLCFNSTHHRLAIGSSAGSIQLYEPDKPGQLEPLLDVHSGSLIGIDVLAPGNEFAISARADGEVQVWHMETAKLVTSLSICYESCSVAASPLTHTVAVGTKAGYVFFVDFNKNEGARIIERNHLHQGPVKHLVYNQSGHFLLTAANDGHVFIVDGRPSQNFKPLGYVALSGDVQGISCYQQGPGHATKVVVTSNQTSNKRSAATKIIHFDLPANLATNIQEYQASLKRDLKDESINKLAFNMGTPSFSIAVTDSNVAFTLAQNSKQLNKISLPSQPPKKDPEQTTDNKGKQKPESEETSKDSFLHPVESVNGHQLPGGRLLMSPHQKWLASVGPDGKLIMRSIGALDRPLEVNAHSYRVGGASGAAFSADACRMFTAGYDGTIACFKWSTGQTKAKSAIEAARMRQTSMLKEMQTEDEIAMALPEWSHPPPQSRPTSGTEKAEKEQLEKEKRIDDAIASDGLYSTPTPTAGVDATWLEERELEAHLDEDKQYSEVKTELRTGIRDMRRQLQLMMTENEDVPEIEKLARHEFDLDIEEQRRLQMEGDSEVTRIRDEKELENLAKQYLAELIKNECWKDMDVKGRGIVAFNSPLEVNNYPMKPRDKEELRVLEQVQIRRQIEITEKAARKEYAEVTDTKPSNTAVEEDPADAEEGTEAANNREKVATNGSLDHPELSALFGVDNDLFYSQFELHTREQKMNQIVLLDDAIFRIKMLFNKEFDKVFDKKTQEILKIKDKNKRIYKILADLDLKLDIYEPEMGVLEKPEMLLSVEEDEVKVEKFLTPEQRKRREEERRLEEERRAREKGDNWRDRALDMMMGGVLEIKKEDELKKDVPQPAFMTAKDESKWTEDEKKLVAEYEKKVKDLNDEREKYRKQLEMELKKLQGLIQDGTEAFDDALKGLFQKKIKMEMVVYQEELKILRLKYSLLQEEELNNREQELNELLEFKRSMKELSAEALQESHKHVDEFKEQYDKLCAEDKVMDRSFKREFNDVPAHYVDQLHKLFRRRPRGQKVRGTETPIYEPSSGNPFAERPSSARQQQQTQRALEVSLIELDKESNAPDGVELLFWQRMCQLRREKIQSEMLVKSKALVMAAITDFLQRRQQEDEKLRDEIEALIEELKDLKDDRMRFTCNLEVQLLLKQGQVEVDPGHFIPNYIHSLLLHRVVVEDLNGRIRNLGESKIASMMESKDFRKGIVQLEWEHHRMTMEMEDLQNKMRDIQNLKVTREIQAYLNEDDHDSKKSQEIQILEQTLVMQKQHHEKNVADRKRHVKDLKKSIRDHEDENCALTRELEELNVAVNERRHIQQVNADKRTSAGREQRYREIVQRRKMVELAKAQAQEVAVLRAEVERLRMRTFPALVQVEH